MPDYTPNYNLKKPLETESYNVNDQNGNMDKIDAAIKAHVEASAPHSGHETPSGAQAKANEAENNAKGYTDQAVTPIITQLASVAQKVNEAETQLTNYNSYASGVDGNGIYTIIEYRRANNTLYMKSTLSNPDTNGNYQTSTWQFYNAAGTAVIETIVWTLSYDADGKIISKVVA